MGNGLFTIGHSNHPIARFLELLGLHRIALICDVRSTPYSRFNPQFNRETLAAALQRRGIGYLYMGDALGGKPKEPGYPADEQARYALIAAGDRFRAGIERLLREAAAHRTAILCAEKDPRNCHRGLLVCPNIPVGVSIRHILADGSLLAQQDLSAGPHPDTPRQPSLL